MSCEIIFTPCIILRAASSVEMADAVIKIEMGRHG